MWSPFYSLPSMPLYLGKNEILIKLKICFYVYYVSHKSVCYLKLFYFSGSISGTQEVSKSPSGLAVVGTELRGHESKEEPRPENPGARYCPTVFGARLAPAHFTLSNFWLCYDTRFSLKTSLSEMKRLSKAAQLVLGNERWVKELWWLLSDLGCSFWWSSPSYWL